ncbi:MAG: S-methyl-5'-thioadenosine phosphorylase [Planctomycetota bacterium]
MSEPGPSAEGTPPAVGVIGGSGLYEIDGLTDLEEVRLSTPFGEPSDAFMTGTLDGVRMVFLPRHGRGHRISPSEINYRANVWGMKRLGVDRILGVGAVGSLREEIPPGDFVAVDQFIDRTRHRDDTFFGGGVVAHVMFGDPVCPALRETLRDAATDAGVRVHDGGTYVCMEGPQFSTRAESEMYRGLGAHVIGMTNLQEAKLAREAEICYATLAMSTDYDCWYEGHDDVTVDAILAVMAQNVGHAREAVRLAAPRAAALGACACHTALESAILTAPDAITEEARLRLGLLLERPLGARTER